jgi:hypothetical protein
LECDSNLKEGSACFLVIEYISLSEFVVGAQLSN